MAIVIGVGLAFVLVGVVCFTCWAVIQISEKYAQIRAVKRHLTSYVASYKLNTRSGKVELTMNSKISNEDATRTLDNILNVVNE